MSSIEDTLRGLSGALRPDGLIDVQKMIASMSHEQMLESADNYFRGLKVNSEQCRKPFSNVDEGALLTRKLGLFFEAADLFRGAHVLDFGCATGWLTLGLADMGCVAWGVDISPAALALAAELQKVRPAPTLGDAHFLVYDGERLPLPDASVDRVLCFDAFHHVRSQPATLAEMARVLRPGGRIAMYEPGPSHSLSRTSQDEMRRYNVIEGDIDLYEIARHARECGLEAPRLLVQPPVALELDLDERAEWAERGNAPPDKMRDISEGMRHTLADTQCFYIRKPGADAMDSRRLDALQARVEMTGATLDRESGIWQLTFLVSNTGKGSWITDPASIGTVTLGCQRIGPGSTLLQQDFKRFAFASGGLPAGSSAQLVVSLPAPSERGDGYRFDLVAEMVCWFGRAGVAEVVDWYPPADSQ